MQKYDRPLPLRPRRRIHQLMQGVFTALVIGTGSAQAGREPAEGLLQCPLMERALLPSIRNPK
ncbi:MAG: hypothetical protein LBG24_04860 [Treponema sp.]|nr:hypothetical protein [Treponema sp.]